MHVIVYGEGGYDPDKPNGNVIDEYDQPDPEVPVTVAADALALAQERVAAATTVAGLRGALTDLLTAFAPSTD